MGDLGIIMGVNRRWSPRNRTTEPDELRLNNPVFAVAGLALLLGLAAPALAVSPQEAKQLKTTLTPMGAERAGNKDGTIPAWTGGYSATSPEFRASIPHADPFVAEKPLFRVP